MGRASWNEIMSFKLKVFENRRDDDTYDCPRVRKGAFKPACGRVSRFRLLKKLHIAAIGSRFRNSPDQRVFNATDGFVEQLFLCCCRIDITLKAFFHFFTFECKSSKKISSFKGDLCVFIYIYKKNVAKSTFFGVFVYKKVF